MKKIIPFKKDIIFKTNLAEITSISLEHSLHQEGTHLISGFFELSGEYKITDTSTNTEMFSYDLPFDIHMDDHYILDNIVLDIDDFYYEIVNENILSVNIDVCVDKLEEKPLIEDDEFEQVLMKREFSKFENDIEEDEERGSVKMEQELKIEEVKIEKEIKTDKEEILEAKKEMNMDTHSIFNTMNEDSETYMSYRIYIVRQGDSIDSILNKYSITKEILGMYNDLSNINLGDKLIIPALYNEKCE